MNSHDTLQIAQLVADRGEKTIPLTHYTGILLMHGMARLSVTLNEEPYLSHVKDVLAPFVNGERLFKCNFRNYQCGGNGTAWLLMLGKLPEAEEAVRQYADELLHQAPRCDDGIYTKIGSPNENRAWIDVAFAVTPFLLFAGLATKEDAYIDEGFQQSLKMCKLFRDKEMGLLHQSRSFCGPGKLSQDHWSRGNGWGIYALAELVNYLPKNDPRRPESVALFRHLVDACLAVQDKEGVWHQEMTDPDSFVETSGTGLILYALGVGLETGLLDQPYRVALQKGLNGYLRYIALDGSVHNTCAGCLCPGDGSMDAYKRHRWVLNDPHAFGPVVLSFSQAWRVGIREVNEA